jgi:hypothetical protein
MSILDKLAATEPARTRSRFGMCVVLEEISDEERAALESTLLVPTSSAFRVTDRQLSEILRSEGHDVSPSVIFRHRQNHVVIQ